MKIVSKLFLIILLAGIAGSFLPAIQHSVFAKTAAEIAAEELADESPIKTPDKIFAILKSIVQYTYTIFFIVAIIFIIVAAFNFLTAKGEPEKIKGARAQILWACVAIAIALISVAAAQIINTFITVS